ncbi:MAG: YscO family type III secretion system apparatus protein [Desulfovibrio sp.]|nr:YscO family type III secretion system apparatus protein [Desulfovibrio sp.]
MALGYPLQALLNVRHFREEAARKEVRAAEQRHAEALRTLERCKADLERYRLWRPEEENRRYATIMGTAMSIDDMAAFRTALTVLAEGEAERGRAVSQAEEVAAQTMQEVRAAKQAAVLARKDAARIESHREIWLGEAQKQNERREDLELEENSGLRCSE